MPRVNIVPTNGPGGPVLPGVQNPGNSDYGFVEIGSDDLNPPGSFPWRVDQSGNMQATSVNAPVVGGLAPSGDNTGVKDSANIQALMNMGARTIMLGLGQFYAQQLAPVTGTRLTGPGYEAASITAPSSYLFNMDPPTGLSPNGNLENIEIDHLTLSASAGDIFNGANITRSSVHHCQLIQNSLANAIWNMSAATQRGTTYMAECRFYENAEIVAGAGNRSISAWLLNANGPFAANDNRWRDNVCFNNCHDTTQPWYYLIGSTGAAFGSRNNKWYDTTFEYPQGGMFRLESTTGCEIDGCTSEDLANLAVGNPMIQLVSGAGTAGCSGITVRNYARRGGNNVAKDILLDSRAAQIEIESPSLYSGGAPFTVDLASGQNIALTGAWPAATTLLNATGATYAGLNGSQWVPNDGPEPADLGYAGEAYDPAAMSGTTGIALTTAGTVYLIKIPVRTLKSVTNIRMHIITAGATLTAGECFAGLYSSAGALIATTADQSVNWAATGTLDMPLAGGPYQIGPGYVWVALLFNGTTGPSFWGNTARSQGMANGTLAAAASRFASANTLQTALPAALTGYARISFQWWAGIW
jgi:hypothetical protein